jgi:hypothetical protein
MKPIYDIGNRFYFPSSIRVFAGLLMGILLTAVIYGSPWVLTVYPLGAYFIFCRGGTQVNFEKNRVRDYQKFFRLKLGLWLPLPRIEYISFRKVTEKFGVRSARAGSFDTHSECKYRVSLVHDQRKMIPLFDSDEHAPALVVAKGLASASGLKVYVVDGRGPARWL